MKYLKGGHLLRDKLSKKDLEMMELAARVHRRYSALHISIIAVSGKFVVFGVEQKVSDFMNYQTEARLKEIIVETFERFFPYREIRTIAKPFTGKLPRHQREYIARKMINKEVYRLMREGVKETVYWIYKRK